MKFAAVLAAVLVAAASPALAAPKARPAAPARVVLPTSVYPERYEIHVRPDAEKLTFDGSEKIAIQVKRPTDRIVLNAADITFRKVALSGRAAAPRIVEDKDQQTAAFVFAKPIAPGRYTLSIDYSGIIYTQASGLFALDYDTPQGKKRALFTQFENSDARRFAPMWDEPGIKSVFSITVDAPADQMVVSNMPSQSLVLNHSEKAAPRQVVRFADSPKMSSYLVFLGLGDFERIHRQVGATDIGVIVRKGEAAKGQYALDAAANLLGFYNDYFGTPYPLPKLDLVAGPGRSQFFGAMENWGAIFYFDYELLLDPKLSSEADKQNIYIVIAHEMAHQWFGDLVTMAWWDDLWLNEGFASWMENKATDHFHPEWKVWLQTLDGQQGAMRLDARAGTHPIITDIPDVFAAANAFDSITYQKGQAVIRMLEAYVGEDAFRQGVRNYIRKHAYGNTVTNDLWAEIDKVSPKPITAIAHDFTLQAGVPLITAAQGPTGLRLTQSRFAADASQKAPRSWRTPVNVAGAGTAWSGVVSAAAPAAARASGPAVVNAGQTGYFRSNYSEELWGGLAPRFGRLQPADQLGLLFDSRALGESGYAPMSRFLDLALRVTPDLDPVVQSTAVDQLEAMAAYFEDRPNAPAFKAFARARLAPLFARVGWEPKAGESDNDAVLRASLIRALGGFDDPAVIAESRQRFAASLKDPDSLRGAVRQSVLRVVAGHADAATWEELHQLTLKAVDPTDRARLYRYLGSASDPALADRTLALALSAEPKDTDRPTLVAAVAAVHPDRAYDFALAHRTELDRVLEPTSRVSYYTGLAGGSRKAAMLEKLKAFAKTAPASTLGEVKKAEASINYRLGVIRERLPEVDRWLAAHPG
jgi:aminopeptidase N